MTNAANFVTTQTVKGALVATLTTTTLSDFESELIAQHIQKEAPGVGWRVVADFAQVQFMSSPGISMVLALLHDARAHKGKFVMCNLNEDIHELLQMTKVDKLMTIVRTLDDAMKKVS